MYVIYRGSIMGYDCADSYGNFYCANYHKFPRNFISKLRPAFRLPAVSAFCSELQQRRQANRARLFRRGAREEVNSWTDHFRQVFRSNMILREITLPIVLCAIADVCQRKGGSGEVSSRLLKTRDIRETVKAA